MFTGLIEEIGTVRRIERGAKGARLTIAADTVLENTKIGDSIAHTANKIHSPPDIRTHNITEILSIHKAYQRILIRHDQCFIHGIHPLHGELHRPAAVQHTGRGVDM